MRTCKKSQTAFLEANQARKTSSTRQYHQQTRNVFFIICTFQFCWRGRRAHTTRKCVGPGGSAAKPGASFQSRILLAAKGGGWRRPGENIHYLNHHVAAHIYKSRVEASYIQTPYATKTFCTRATKGRIFGKVERTEEGIIFCYVYISCWRSFVFHARSYGHTYIYKLPLSLLVCLWVYIYTVQCTFQRLLWVHTRMPRSIKFKTSKNMNAWKS
jgi:hypothetical protein